MKFTAEDHERAAAIIRGMKSAGEHVPITHYLSPEDFDDDECIVTIEESNNVAAWTAREAFVVFFSVDEEFDADKFRESCKPLSAKRAKVACKTLSK